MLYRLTVMDNVNSTPRMTSTLSDNRFVDELVLCRETPVSRVDVFRLYYQHSFHSLLSFTLTP
jgi:hypothetical protein